MLISFTVKLVSKIMSWGVWCHMSLCAPINAIASRGKSSPNVAAKVGGMCLHGDSHSQGRQLLLPR